MNPLKDSLNADVEKDGAKYLDQLQKKLLQNKEENAKNDINSNLKRKSKYNFEIDDLSED